MTSSNTKANNISDITFTVVDVETTGLSSAMDRITEIALVNVKNGEITSEYSTLVNPQQFIPSYITSLTGITNEMVYDQPVFNDILPEINNQLGKHKSNTILAGHNVSFDYRFLNTSLERVNAGRIYLPSLCTGRLARRLNRTLRSKSLPSLCNHFGIRVERRHRALDDARATALILIRFIDQLINEYEIETLDDLLSFQYKKIYEPSKLPQYIKRIKPFIRKVPDKPGVYYMKDKNDDIIYIGKAKNLKDRLQSYFYHNVSHTSKVRKLIRNVYSVEYEITGSELSALITESKMIKLHKPKFNTASKRYGHFPLIRLDVQNTYPKAEKVYEVRLDGARYYGPFKSSFTVESLLERINKTYKLRKCKDRKLQPSKGKSTCMYFEMHQCDGPCNFTQKPAEYKSEVNRVIKFLEAETSSSALKQLEKKMYTHSDNLEFEEASHIRDRIADLKKVMLNMELTASEVNMKNYIVKCKDTNEENSFEVFFISNGKLVKNIQIEQNNGYEYEPEYLMDTVNNIYFNGNLFGSILYNSLGKFNREEMDRMKIISNWLYQNNSPSTVFKVNNRTSAENILSFIYHI